MKISVIDRSWMLLLMATLFSTQGLAQSLDSVYTDKAMYQPGEPVELSVRIEGDYTANLQLAVSYYHLGDQLSSDTLSISGDKDQWSWQPPQEDFHGYMIGLELMKQETIVDLKSIAVDVSSDWSKFPRYGFLSKFGDIPESERQANIRELNRFHINGIQFYDWHYRHEKPLPDQPREGWRNIGNHQISYSTVKGYINEAHQRGMKAMAYNLIYGTFSNYDSSAIKEEWFLYQDDGSKMSYGDFPDSWATDKLYWMNIDNRGWSNHIAGEMNAVYDSLSFDGWHADQLGDWGTMYNYSGDPLVLKEEIKPFLDSMKSGNPDQKLVLNAVDQYGQNNIASSEVEFLYTEPWSPKTYNELAGIIQQNDAYSNSRLSTVLAAYMHYRSTPQAYFNTPAVLLTDAVIFAFGGAHLQLGEHMLYSEYFPDNYLNVSDSLRNALVNYYDFLSGYENLLRGPSKTIRRPVRADSLIINQWPAQKGQVASLSKKVGQREVIHLLNFRDATTMDWRDKDFEQVVPTAQKNFKIRFSAKQEIQNIWVASPDYRDGLPVPVDFQQDTAGMVHARIPFLRYWTMVVAEYKNADPLSVHFKNTANWSEPYVHYWNTEPKETGGTQWPGKKMEPAPEEGQDWYRFDFPSGVSISQLVFSDNGANKTQDLQIRDDAYYIYDKGWAHTLPGRIEAEDYNAMSGIKVIEANDINGISNVGYTDKGDWFEYEIKVAQTDSFSLKYRAASNVSSGSLYFIVDGDTLKERNILHSGGWQNYTTYEDTVSLTQGWHRFRIHVKEGAFNLNWLDFSPAMAQPEFDINDDTDEDQDTTENDTTDIGTSLIDGVLGNNQGKMVVFPNPILDNTINIQLPSGPRSDAELFIYGLNGRLICRSTKYHTQPPMRWTLPLSRMDKGVYILKVRYDQKTYVTKVLYSTD